MGIHYAIENQGVQKLKKLNNHQLIKNNLNFTQTYKGEQWVGFNVLTFFSTKSKKQNMKRIFKDKNQK